MLIFLKYCLTFPQCWGQSVSYNVKILVIFPPVFMVMSNKQDNRTYHASLALSGQFQWWLQPIDAPNMSPWISKGLFFPVRPVRVSRTSKGCISAHCSFLGIKGSHPSITMAFFIGGKSYKPQLGNISDQTSESPYNSLGVEFQKGLCRARKDGVM